MHRAHRFLTSFLLAAALVAPVAVIAAPAPQRVNVQLRVYDKQHKDYHNWDDREDLAYRRYLSENHQTYRVYTKQNHKKQEQYWTWRHSNPDRD